MAIRQMKRDGKIHELFDWLDYQALRCLEISLPHRISEDGTVVGQFHSNYTYRQELIILKRSQKTFTISEKGTYLHKTLHVSLLTRRVSDLFKITDFWVLNLTSLRFLGYPPYPLDSLNFVHTTYHLMPSIRHDFAIPLQ